LERVGGGLSERGDASAIRKITPFRNYVPSVVPSVVPHFLLRRKQELSEMPKGKNVVLEGLKRFC
jgi:hypothetical protein